MAAHYRRLLSDALITLMPTLMLRQMTRRRLVGLMYHAVSDEELPHVTNLYTYNTPEEFERHLDFLQAHFTLVSCREIRDSFDGRKALPENPAFISFDDGFAECFSIVRPILLKRKIPCVFFLTKDFIDNQKMFYRNTVSLLISALRELETISTDPLPLYDTFSSFAGKLIDSRTSFETWIRSLDYTDHELLKHVADVLEVDIEQYLKEKKPYLTSEQVVALANDGFEIGAHSLTHRNLEELDQAEAIEEIVTSCHWIRELLKIPKVPFAFPYGGKNFSRGLLKQLMDEQDIDLFCAGEVLKIEEPSAVGRIWAEYSLDSRRERLSRIVKRAALRDLLGRS